MTWWSVDDTVTYVETMVTPEALRAKLRDDPKQVVEVYVSTEAGSR